MSISITCMTKPHLPYKSINLFKLLLRWSVVWLGMCSTVMNFSFLTNVIMNKFPLTNITPAMRKHVQFLKSSGIFTYSSVSTLLGLFLVVFTLTPDRSVPNIEFAVVMSCVVIGQFGSVLLLPISLYSQYVGCPAIPCRSRASFSFYTSLLVYTSKCFLSVWMSSITESVFLSLA